MKPHRTLANRYVLSSVSVFAIEICNYVLCFYLLRVFIPIPVCPCLFLSICLSLCISACASAWVPARVSMCDSDESQ